MKIAIIGSRDFNDYKLLSEKIFDYFAHDVGFYINEIISGGAKGADSLGAQFAKQYNIKLTEFLPDWDKYGKRAGFLRNEDIVKNADIIVAFWNGLSKGTGHSLSIAKRLKKDTIIFYF